MVASALIVSQFQNNIHRISFTGTAETRQECYTYLKKIGSGPLVVSAVLNLRFCYWCA